MLSGPVDVVVNEGGGNAAQLAPLVFDVVPINVGIKLFLVDGREFVASEMHRQSLPGHWGWRSRELAADVPEDTLGNSIHSAVKLFPSGQRSTRLDQILVSVNVATADPDEEPADVMARMNQMLAVSTSSDRFM